MACTVEKTDDGVVFVDGDNRIEVKREKLGELLNQAAVRADNYPEAKAKLVEALTKEKPVDLEIAQAIQRFMRADHVRKVELRRKLKEIEDRAQATARAEAAKIMSEADELKSEGKARRAEDELKKAEGQAP